MPEKPELRAEPVEAKDLQKASPDELKKIREQAETDSGVKRNLDDPKYVTALNKAWAEHYRDQGHPLVDKILAFQDEWDTEAAVEAVKKIQRDLKVKDDGVIWAETLRAYHAKLEADEKAWFNWIDAFSDTSKGLVEINVLGKEEKQEKIKTNSEELKKKIESGETEGLVDVHGQPLDSSSTLDEIRWTGENSDKFYNPESGEYETKEERKKRWEELKEKEAAAKNEELSRIEWVLNRGEDVSTLGTDYQYAMEWSNLTRSDDTNGTTETWNDSRKTWETTEKKEESDFQDLTKTTKWILEKYGDTTSNEWRKIKSYKLGELDKAWNGDKGIDRDMAALREQVKPLMEKNPKMAEMTLEQFQQLQEKPEGFATSDLVPKDWTTVRPEEFGLKPDGYSYSYPNSNRNTVVARPTWDIKKGEELDQIKVKMGWEEGFQTQRQFLETRARQIPEGQKFDLPGSPEFTYEKTETGDLQVYRKGSTVGETGPVYTYNAPRGNTEGKWVENTQWTVNQLTASSDIDFSSPGNIETPETSTAGGWIMEGGIGMAQR